MNRDTLTSPINVGGLGIRDMRLTNISLLGKLIWCMLHDTDKLWVQVLTHKYLGQNSIWCAPKATNASITWRGILKAMSALREGFGMRLNAGNSSLWYTDWRGTRAICNSLDYVHISDTRVHLRDVWDNGQWCLDQLYTPLPDHIKQEIINTSVPHHPNDNIPDCWVWNGNHDGIYKASTGYGWLIERSREWNASGDWKWVWRAAASAKVQFLLWLISHDALPTNQMKHNRGIAPSPSCGRCSGNTKYSSLFAGLCSFL